MKKIISGFFFRAVKTAELWIFVALIVVISFANIRTERIEIKNRLTSDYQLTDTLEVTYEKAGIFNSDLDSDIDLKIDYLIRYLNFTLVIPALMTPLFTVLFMGKLFSEGALRNLIASGHSKTRVYLASLIFGSSVTALFNILSLVAMSLAMLIQHWKIPIFFPLLGTCAMYMFTVDIVMLSLTLCVLFISKRPVVSLIAVAGSIIILFSGYAGATMAALLVPERQFSSSKLHNYCELHPDSEILHDSSFDIKNFSDIIVITENGEILDEEIYLGRPNPNHIGGIPRKIMVASLYANPGCGFLMSLLLVVSHYRMWKDGLYIIFCLTNFMWIVIIYAAGLILFRRQDLN